ncbi:CsiV family protein [Parahaliea mediterranea]|uniref:CsiV family protein n=1 Tax=Parahaliea mediterranea TaxID=651086 RepID=UPI000E2EBB61|nr:CsiV family protein [Parahaliea mediterranea]
MKPFLTAFTPLLGLIYAGIAWAQPPAGMDDDSDQRWYRVELLIFSQGGSAAASQEQWDPQPPLAYPERYRFLVYPERVAQRIASHPDGESRMEANGQQVIAFAAPDAGEQAQQGKTPGATDIPRRGEGEGEAAGGPASGGAAPGAEPLAPAPTAEAPAKPQLPTPWVVRPASELEFRGKAAYMEKRGSYRVLFHQTWLQPVQGESQARDIIIDDSGSQQRYPELQGSIKLFVSRYLHISTNLWLNTDGRYLAGDWRMPAPPLAPASLAIEKPVDPAAFAPYAANAPAGLPATAPANAQTETSSTTAPDDPAAVLASDTPDAAEPAYPYRHAVLLQQRRRMRSTEVHYIDHPMLGVVVKLSPLSDEQLEQFGAEEAAVQAKAIDGQANNVQADTSQPNIVPAPWRAKRPA